MVALALGGVFALSTLSQYEAFTFLHGDSSFYATVNRSLLDGHLEQHQHQPMSWYDQDLGWNRELDAGWSNIALGRDHQYYPKHPLLLPLLGTPWYALFGNNGLLLMNILMFVGALTLAFRIGVRVVRPEAIAVTVVLLAMSPIFTRVAYSYSNDILYTVLAIWGIERFLAGDFSLSGLGFGLSIVSKPTTALLAIPFVVWLLYKHQVKPLLRMATWGAPPIIAWLLMNWWMFGTPWTTAYNRILVRHNGQPSTFDIASKFHRPWPQGWREIWGAPYEGLWENCSLAFAGLLGVPWLARRAPLLTVTLLLSMAGFFYFYIPFEYTYARFFLPWATLLAVPLAIFLERIVAGAMAVSAWLEKKHQALPLIALLALVLAIGLGRFLSQGDGHRWHASQAIAQAKVEENPGPQAIPCDYFNPAQQKWECATRDPEAWQRWGLALQDQCKMPDGSAGWLWLHPHPNAAKRITFSELPSGRLTLRYGLAPSARQTGLELRVQDGQAPVQTLQVKDIGQIHELQLPQHAAKFSIELPRQSNDWRHFCVDLYVD